MYTTDLPSNRYLQKFEFAWDSLLLERKGEILKRSKSLFEALRALKNAIQALFTKMPALFLVLVYLIDLGIRSYLSEGFSTTYLLGILILFISIGIYINTRSFSETTLSFILGILTIYSIDWEVANITLFVILYLVYIILVFYISVIRLSAKQETILSQAACKLNIENYDKIYKQIKTISQKTTKYNQLSILDKSEIIRYLAFRQVIISEYEDAIDLIELIKGVCQTDIISCCEIYYGFYTYCRNKRSSDISGEIQKMFDKVTMLTMSYIDFFNVFDATKRILVEQKLNFEKYLFELKELSLKGYNSEDIIDLMKDKYL